jgi:hypothetical protein
MRDITYALLSQSNFIPIFGTSTNLVFYLFGVFDLFWPIHCPIHIFHQNPTSTMKIGHSISSTKYSKGKLAINIEIITSHETKLYLIETTYLYI